MIVIGVAVSIKRLIVSLLLGRRTFAHFGQELADVMTKMLLIGSVATLSREIETDRRAYLSKRNPSYIQSVGSNLSGGWNPDTINQFVEQETDAALALEADAARQAAAQTTAADAAKTFVRKQKAHVSPPPSPGSPIQQALAGRDDDAAGAEFTESEQVAISELLDGKQLPYA